MGFATNQTEASVRIFCQSLRQVYRPEECDVTIVTNRHEAYFSELARLGIRFESTPNNYSAATRTSTKLVNRLVLHMYDRWPDTAALCRERYAGPGAAPAA